MEEEEEEPSTVAAAAAAGSGGLKMGKYVHERIKNIETAVFDDEDEDEDEDDHDFMLMVDDPLEETVVAITITINRYMSSSQSSSSSSSSFPAAPETVLPEEDTTTKRSYVLEGFLKDNTPDELDDLLRDKTVTAPTLERIKETISRRRFKIKEIALELRRKQIVIHMKLDLLTSYSDDDQEEDLGVGETVDDDDDDDDDDYDYDCDDCDEEMFEFTEDEYDDDVMNWKPALPYSVEALETSTFENKEDLEMMLKSTSCRSSCGICLDEFSIDVAVGKISIKTMPCSHFFHSECIVPWLEKRHTCPICRYEMPTAATA